MGELVWLALAKGSFYLFWLIWGVWQAQEGLAFFPAQKNAHLLNFVILFCFVSAFLLIALSPTI